MSAPLDPRPGASATEMAHLVLPYHANVHGTVLGGTVMHWIDMAAAVVANRHCRRPVVTAAIDEMSFLAPIQVGQLALIHARITLVDRSSMEIRVDVESENLPIIYCAYSGNGDPWYYGVRYQWAPGSGNLDNAKERPVRVPDGLPREVLAVSAMVLHSVHFSDTEVWAPLRRQKPIAMPGYSYFVFDITRNADAHAYIAALYLSFGMDDLADYEAHRTLRLDPKSAVALAVLDKLKEKATAPPGAPGG